MKDNYLIHIYEAMNALISANNMPGLKGTDNNTDSVYIVNYMQNNAFANGLTTDYKMRHMITRDPDDKKLKMKSVDNQDNYGFDCSTSIEGIYKVTNKANLSEGLEKIKANIGKEVDEGFIYECILGDKMYSWDQIEFSDKVERVTPFKDALSAMEESIRNYTLYGKEKAELIYEIKYGNKDMSTLLSEYSNILLEKKSSFKIYYGLTEEESKQDKLVYKGNSKYTHKGVNTSLEGLKKFIKDNHMEDTITKYTILNSNIFDIDDSVYPDKEYDMISVKIPFEFTIGKVYDLNININESKIFNLKDIYYNKDKFDSGEINLCFITGFSGSGKSTMANYYKDCISICLDDIVENYRFTDEQLKEYDESVYKFFTTIGKEFRLSNESDINSIGAYVHKCTKSFCQYIMNYSKGKSNKYIIDGIQLYGALTPDILPFKEYAVYIKGTSKLVSSYRAAKRNANNDKANGDKVSIKDKINMFKAQYNDKDENKFFTEWYNYFKKLDSKEVVEEATNPSKEPSRFENLGGFLLGRVILDNENKCFIIKGIDFRKFLLRLKEMYQYRGILNLFEQKYSWWSMHLWEKNRINKQDMKITNLSVNLFFALELYKICLDLADFYNLPYYKHIAEAIYKKTWISNYEKKDYCKYTKTNNLSKFAYQLKDYQVEFVKNYSFLKSKYDLTGYILSFEQGLGKTLTATALAECLNKDQIIIVCPNSLRENWAYEITDYYKKYSGDMNKSVNDIYVYNSSKFNKAKAPKFIIVNQESIDKIFDVVKKNKNTMIIVDECHNFRNIDSLRVTNLLKLKDITKCKDNLMMSGTPIKATAEEIIPILRMIDPYFTDDLVATYKKSFKSNTVAVADVIKERFGRILYRKTKNEVLNLPNKTITDLPLNVKNPDLYSLRYIRDQVAIEYKAEFDKRYPSFKALGERYIDLINTYSSADRKLTKKYIDYIKEFADPFTSNGSQAEDFLSAEELVYKAFLDNYVLPNIRDEATKKELLELKSKYVYFKNSVMSTALGRVYPPARNNCYKEIFDYNRHTFISMINKNLKKTIIFTPFLEVAKHISEELKKSMINNILIVGGSKNRMDLINEFKLSDDIDVLIATTQTLSTGVTLTEANQMIFFGTPYRNADFTQACDRIHRIGQTQDVTIYITKLDSKTKNITNRIDEILKWSDEISSSLMEAGIIE